MPLFDASYRHRLTPVAIARRSLERPLAVAVQDRRSWVGNRTPLAQRDKRHLLEAVCGRCNDFSFLPVLRKPGACSSLLRTSADEAYPARAPEACRAQSGNMLRKRRFPQRRNVTAAEEVVPVHGPYRGHYSSP